MESLAREIVRPAVENDVVRIWEIRNDASTRSVSGSSDPIPLHDHRKWFECRYFVDFPSNYCFILETGGEVAGYCRFDESENPPGFIVSIALGEMFRNRGMGHTLLSRAIELFRVIRKDPANLFARIMDNNCGSISLFHKNGFVLCGDNCYRLEPSEAGPEKD